MKPLPDHVIEWIMNLPNKYAFELSKHCQRCGDIKPICALSPTGRWVCGECWPKFFVMTDDPLKQ